MKARLSSNLTLLATAIVATLACVEIALRIGGFSHAFFYTRDARRGAALRPGASGWWTAEGREYVRINSRGLRDREHALAKPPGTFRVAVLGDSYAEALQLPMEQAFWAVLERELGGCAALGGRTVEVINFGVSGYGTAQELLTLRHVAWGYEPDAVVLAFLTGNDVRNNARAIEGDPDRPYFIERDGRLVLDDSYRERLPSPAMLRLSSFSSELLNRVRLLQLVKAAIDAVRAPASQATAFGAEGAGSAATGGEPGLDDAVYLPPQTAAWESAWRVTEGLLGMLAVEVHDRDAQLLVVTLSNQMQVHPDPAARSSFMQARGIEDLFYPDRRIVATCERLGVPALPLAPLLLEHAQRTGEFLHGFGEKHEGGHWNALGHRLAGELIAVEVCRMLGNPATPAVDRAPAPPAGKEDLTRADRVGRDQ